MVAAELALPSLAAQLVDDGDRCGLRSRLRSTTTIGAHGVRCPHPAVQFTRVRRRREDGSAARLLDQDALEPTRPERSPPTEPASQFSLPPSAVGEPPRAFKSGEPTT